MPVTPEIAIKNINSGIPPKVIEAFDECILDSFSDTTAVVLREDVISKIIEKYDAGSSVSLSRQYIFGKKWLAVENIYRELGWRVSFRAEASPGIKAALIFSI